MQSVEKEIFKNKIKKIEKFKGKHTELISLYIPYGTDRSYLGNQLTQEISQASNIKSPTTRKNVQSALRKILSYLKMIDYKIDENGMVIFCGNVSEKEGRSDIQLYHIVPPKKLNIKMYRCDSSFVVDPLKEMLSPDKAYVIIAIDNKEATIALLEGKKYKILDRLTSAVPGKIRAGGQSANRFARLRIDAAKDFYRRISEHANKEALPIIDKIQGLIIGGPGNTKKDFYDRELLDYRLRNKFIAFVDVTYTDESGIKEIIDKSKDILKETEIIKEKEIVSLFFKKVIKDENASYGLNEVINALKENRVEKLLISEALEKEVKIAKCGNCNKKLECFDECKCCGDIEILETITLAEYLKEIADKQGSQIFVISTDTEEGKQFFNAFGGIGAILRY